MTFLLPVLSGFDFITGVISIITQSVIIANHGDCAYSKMGVGIWNGLLLLTTAISLAFFHFKKANNNKNWTLVICSLSLMASLVQVGVASGVIFQLLTLQYFNHGPYNISPQNKGLLGEIVDQFMSQGISPNQYEKGRINNRPLNAISIPDNVIQWITKAGYTLVSNVEKKVQIRSCYTLEDTYGSQRTTLEIVLLVCGLVSILVKMASFLALRMNKRTPDSSVIQYTQTISN